MRDSRSALEAWGSRVILEVGDARVSESRGDDAKVAEVCRWRDWLLRMVSVRAGGMRSALTDGTASSPG